MPGDLLEAQEARPSAAARSGNRSRRGWSCSGRRAGRVRPGACSARVGRGQRSWRLCHIDPLGCQQGGQFLGGKLLEVAPLLVAGRPRAGGRSRAARASRSARPARPAPADSGRRAAALAGRAPVPSARRSRGARHGSRRSRPPPGTGRSGSTDDGHHGSPGQGRSGRLGCGAVGERLLRHDHLGVGLSRGVAEGTGMSSSSPFRSRSGGSACHAILIGFPPSRE